MENPVKGTHDIVGDEALMYREIETCCINVAKVFGYDEIRTPILEHTPLFLRSVGESSDIVHKEMYTFDDKGGRSVTLRPEMTAGVMRSIVSNKLYALADMPMKYFYVGPCFRYERPQAGRYREFTQFGCEVFGSNSPMLDAEIISIPVGLLCSPKIVGRNAVFIHEGQHLFGRVLAASDPSAAPKTALRRAIKGADLTPIVKILPMLPPKRQKGAI